MSISKIRAVLFVLLIVIIILWVRFWGDETRIVRSSMSQSAEIVWYMVIAVILGLVIVAWRWMNV